MNNITGTRYTAVYTRPHYPPPAFLYKYEPTADVFLDEKKSKYGNKKEHMWVAGTISTVT